MGTKMWIGLLAAALASGCVSAGHFGELPQRDRDRFLRCQHAMRPNLCGDDQDQVYVTNCIRQAEGDYSEQRGAQARGEWLVEHGCPAAMVGGGS